MSHKKQRFPYRRHVRLGCGLEQIEPRLLLSATVEPIVQMGPPAPGGQGGFLDLSPVFWTFSAGNSATTGIVVRQANADRVEALSEKMLIFRPDSDRGHEVIPPPMPSKPKDGGGFVDVSFHRNRESTDHVPEEVTVLAEPTMPLAAPNAPPPINLGAALQLQPARGQAHAFQLASSAAPESASTIQRVAPPLPGGVLSSSATPAPATLQASLGRLASPHGPSANAEVVQSLGPTIQLAGAVEIPVRSELPSSALLESGQELNGLSAETPADPPDGVTAEDELQAGGEPAGVTEGHAEAPGTSLVMATATAANEVPSSQTAMVVTLAILVWQAGTAYFLPAEAVYSRLPQGR